MQLYPYIAQLKSLYNAVYNKTQQCGKNKIRKKRKTNK